METSSRSQQADGIPSSAPEAGTDQEHALPPHGGALERITGHGRGLVADVQAWVDLKLKLTQVRVENKIERRLNRLVVNLLVAACTALAGLFALFTAAWALGAWLGHPAWGFLVVTLLLMAVAGIVATAKPHLVRMAHDRMPVDEDEVTDPPGTSQRSVTTP